MKPAPFAYHAPSSLGECLRLLATHQDDAAVLAGGQSLVPLMRFRVAQPAHVVSIRGIGGTLALVERAADAIVVGAAVTYSRAQRDAAVRAACPGLPAAIDLIATPAVRSRGTLCGNLCQADPASELPAVSLAVDARFHLRSMTGNRIVAAKDFFLGPYTTARRADEMLVGVEFPVRPAAERLVVREVSRVRGGFPMAGVAIALTLGEDADVRAAAVACFGVHANAIRVPGAEAALRGQGCTPGGIAAAADAIGRAIEPHSDAFASAEYRRAATRALFRQAVEEVRSGAGGLP